ncbi:hypothetical protein B0H12DRAFT_353180 [Mycena haematopus]|nr:hypothetical protein B0H12DRAFT_353180 [Mycena haematopus]
MPSTVLKKFVMSNSRGSAVHSHTSYAFALYSLNPPPNPPHHPLPLQAQRLLRPCSPFLCPQFALGVLFVSLLTSSINANAATVLIGCAAGMCYLRQSRDHNQSRRLDSHLGGAQPHHSELAGLELTGFSATRQCTHLQGRCFFFLPSSIHTADDITFAYTYGLS